jgi:hypothetical protein
VPHRPTLSFHSFWGCGPQPQSKSRSSSRTAAWRLFPVTAPVRDGPVSRERWPRRRRRDRPSGLDAFTGQDAAKDGGQRCPVRGLGSSPWRTQRTWRPGMIPERSPGSRAPRQPRGLKHASRTGPFLGTPVIACDQRACWTAGLRDTRFGNSATKLDIDGMTAIESIQQ